MNNLWEKWSSLLMETRLKYIAGVTAIIQFCCFMLPLIMYHKVSYIALGHFILWLVFYLIWRHFERRVKNEK